MEATVAREPDGTETPLPTFQHHLLSDDDGGFPAELKGWEVRVLRTEMAREGFVAWYRNPSRPSQDSFGIAYLAGANVKIVRPDFIFFSRHADGSFAADIVDPHGTFLSDALPKLQGMARFAESHANAFRRIEAVAEVGDKLRVLDLTRTDVRSAVLTAKDAKGLYASNFAAAY